MYFTLAVTSFSNSSQTKHLLIFIIILAFTYVFVFPSPISSDRVQVNITHVVSNQVCRARWNSLNCLPAFFFSTVWSVSLAMLLQNEVCFPPPLYTAPLALKIKASSEFDNQWPHLCKATENLSSLSLLMFVFFSALLCLHKPNLPF